MKLIKINTDHYIIVDDSEIKEGDWYYWEITKTIQIAKLDSLNRLPKNSDGSKKITHSTQPLESFEDFYKRNPYKLTRSFTEDDWYSSMYERWKEQQLSLSEVKELIGEVDVEKKILKLLPDDSQWQDRILASKIYNQALEDNKDKKYTEEDLRKAIEMAQSQYWDVENRGFSTGTEGDWSFKYTEEEIIQSLQPKTEWDVEIIDGQLKQTKNEILHNKRN